MKPRTMSAASLLLFYPEPQPVGVTHDKAGCALNNNQKYVYSGVDFIKSRNNFSWQEGLDYTIGLGIRPFVNGAQNATDQLANNGANGNWESQFSSYRLCATGIWNTIDQPSGSLWNGSFAFAQLQDFDIRVCASNFSNARDAGILIRQNMAQNLSSSPFIYFFFDVVANTACLGYRTASGFQPYSSWAGPNNHLQATKQNNIIRLYTSTDGKTYTLRKELTTLTGTVFAGMAMSPNNATTQGKVLFSGVSIKSEAPIAP